MTHRADIEEMLEIALAREGEPVVVTLYARDYPNGIRDAMFAARRMSGTATSIRSNDRKRPANKGQSRFDPVDISTARMAFDEGYTVTFKKTDHPLTVADRWNMTVGGEPYTTPPELREMARHLSVGDFKSANAIASIPQSEHSDPADLPIEADPFAEQEETKP